MQSSENKKKELNVIIVSGEKDAERAIFGLAFALTAATMDYKVTVFLVMDGARLASLDLEDRIIIRKYNSIPSYLQLLQEMGVTIAVCSSCIEEDICDDSHNNKNKKSSDEANFNVPNSFSKAKNLRKGIKIMGLASLFSSEDVEFVVY